MFIFGRDKIQNRFEQANERGYAIPAFNFTDIWDLLAIVRAAEELRAPVIAMAEPAVFNLIGLDLSCQLGKAAAQSVQAPIYIHLDHADQVADCINAINFGYSSVMIDASSLSLQDNIDRVKQVTDIAHRKGIFVEAELGKIKSQAEDAAEIQMDDYLVNVDDAIKLVQSTKVDSLAVGIGTAHGFYKNKPEINFARLEEVASSLKIPLVLHGGSGIPESDVRKAISTGIRKVNVGTDVNCSLTNGLKSQLEKYGNNQYIYDIIQPVISSTTDVVKKWILICMADGKA